MKKSKYVGLLLLGLMVIGVTGGVWTSNEFIYKPSLGARGQTEKDHFDVSMDRVDNRLGKEIWVGDPNYGTTLQDAITAIGSTNASLHIPAGTHNIAANLTIPANVNLKPERGTIFAVATTKTLTVNGGLGAELHQVFTCAGTGTVVFGNKVPKVYPHWFGAAGDATTDDAVAINRAAVCARASTCKTITFPPGSGYRTTAQLDLRQLNVEMAGTTVVSAVSGAASILIGGNGSTAYSLSGDISISAATIPTWTAGTTGILVSDMDDSKWTMEANGFETGIKFLSGTSSCSYNVVTLKSMKYNKISLYAYNDPGATGWTNENLVLGGCFGGNASPAATACVKLKNVGGWVFQKPSFEHMSGVGVIFDGCANNMVRNAHFESDVATVAQFANAANKNLMTLSSFSSHGAGAMDWDFDTTDCYTNDVRMANERPYGRILDITNFDSAYDDGVDVHVPGFEFVKVADGTITQNVANGNIRCLYDHGSGASVSSYAAYVPGRKVGFIGSPAYGIYRPQKLYIKCKGAMDTDNPPPLVIICYDSTGAVLSGTSPYYVKGNMVTTFGVGYRADEAHFYDEFFGGVYRFHPDVAYAFIANMCVNRGTGLEIHSPYNVDLLPVGRPQEAIGGRVASQAPTKWHFARGEMVWNSGATTGQPSGWVCIKRVDTTLAANASGGNTSVTVASATGIANGDVIGIKLDTGRYHFTIVNGAPAGSTVTLTAALPGSGVVATSGNAAVANLWKAMPNL